MSGRVTIKSIARDLEISHMTVSRALSGHPNVSEPVRASVVAYAAKSGYVKSAAAGAMRGDGTRMVGLLLPNLVNEFYARFADALAAACADSKLHLIIHLTNDQPDKEAQALLRLREVEAGAVLMVPAPGVPDGDEKSIGDLKVIQLIRRRPQVKPAPALLVADHDAIIQAIGHLAAKGHSEIAYIGGHPILSSGQDRLAAYNAAMQGNDQPVASALVRTGAPSFAMGYRNAMRLIEDGRATAIVCGGLEISNGALEACLRRGVALPQDIAFVGYGDPAHYTWIGGGVSTISLPVEELARNAARVLEKSIGSDRLKAEGETFPASFIRRHTA